MGRAGSRQLGQSGLCSVGCKGSGSLEDGRQLKKQFFSGKNMLIWKVYVSYQFKYWKVQSLDFMP